MGIRKSLGRFLALVAVSALFATSAGSSPGRSDIRSGGDSLTTLMQTSVTVSPSNGS